MENWQRGKTQKKLNQDFQHKHMDRWVRVCVHCSVFNVHIQSNSVQYMMIIYNTPDVNTLYHTMSFDWKMLTSQIFFGAKQKWFPVNWYKNTRKLMHTHTHSRKLTSPKSIPKINHCCQHIHLTRFYPFQFGPILFHSKRRRRRKVPSDFIYWLIVLFTMCSDYI